MMRAPESQMPKAPEGEGMRFGASRDGDSAYFGQPKTCKRSIALLDFKNPEAICRVHRLAEESSIVAENLRPCVLQRLGIGYQTTHTINLRLVRSGYGQRRPAVEVLERVSVPRSDFCDPRNAFVASHPSERRLFTALISGVGEYAVIIPPWKMSGAPTTGHRDSPGMGQHARSLRSDVPGLLSQEAQRPVKAGVFGELSQ
jgi:crotonobetainyl-CoA:carnitine CoA-transferase CaiB-like acyl-CoA transferase